MELGKRHDTTDTADFCPRQSLTDLFGETGVMDFGLKGNRGRERLKLPQWGFDNDDDDEDV